MNSIKSDELDFVIFAKPVYCVDLQSFANDASVNFKLIQSLFCQEPRPRVCHYHYNAFNNEAMLITSQNLEKSFETLPLAFKKYVQIQLINTNAYMDDTGLVSKVSTFFAENNISILYITTCQSNFVYVELKDYDNCLQLLSQQEIDVQIVQND